MVLIAQLLVGVIVWFLVRTTVLHVCNQKMDKLRRKGKYPGRGGDMFSLALIRDMASPIALISAAVIVLIAMFLFLV